MDVRGTVYKYYLRTLDGIAAITVYYFQGVRYASVVPFMIQIMTLLYVSDYLKSLPFVGAGNVFFYAIIITIIFLAGIGLLGFVTYGTIVMRENNMTVKNSPLLNDRIENIEKVLVEMNEHIKALEARE